MPASPLALTVPVRVTTSHRDTVLHIPLTNSGTSPVHLTSGMLSTAQHGGACALAKPPSWVTVALPASELAPGAHEVAVVTVSAPPAVTGKTELLAVFRTAAAHKPGTASVSGAIATRVDIVLPGKTAPGQCVTATATPRPPVASHGGSSAGLAIGLALALVMVLAVVLAVVGLRRRHNKSASA